MIAFAYPIHTDLDPAPMPGWYVQRQLETALAQARQEEAKTMTAAQHTPGPWTAEERLPHCWTIQQLHCMPHATVFPRDSHTNPEDDYPASVQIAEANARLIAAAPELLEALRSLDTLAESMAAVLVSLGYGAYRAAYLNTHASAAIARATA